MPVCNAPPPPKSCCYPSQLAGIIFCAHWEIVQSKPKPLSPLPAGGMVEFRRSLAASFLFKGLLWASQQLERDTPAYESPFPDSYRSGGTCVNALCVFCSG